MAQAPDHQQAEAAVDARSTLAPEWAERFVALSRDLFVVADSNGRIVAVNDAWEHNLGWMRDDLIHRQYHELVHPDDLVAAVAATAVRGHAGNHRLTIRLRAKTGGWRWLEWTAETSPEDGYTYGSARDVTAEVEADRDRRETDDRHRLLIDHLPDAVIVALDHDLCCTFIGGGGMTIAGVDGDTVVGRNAKDILGPFGADADRILAHCRDAVAGTPSTADIHSATTGEDYSVAFVPIAAETHRPASVLAVCTNVTQRLATNQQASTLAHLVAHAGDGIVCLALDGTITSANRAACKMFGYTEDELIGQSSAIFLPPASVPSPTEYYAAVARNTTWRGELPRVRKNGTVLTVLATVSPVIDEHGTSIGISAFLQDVTEQRTVEHALRKATERFRQAFQHAPIGMAVVATTGQWLRANPALCTLLGYTEEELYAKTFQDITHPDDLAEDIALLEELAAGRTETYQMEKRYIRADGKVVSAMLAVSLVRDDDGTPLHFISQIEDITERKVLEARVREETARWRLAFDQAPIGKGLVSLDGIWTEANNAACELLGYSEEELLGKSVDDLTHPEDLEGTRLLVIEALTSTHGSFTVEKRYIRSDGSSVWCLLSVSVVRNDEGEPLHFITQIQNIDERRILEAQLRSAADLDDLTGVLNRRGFDHALEAATSGTEPLAESSAVLFLDLDGFKEVNDTYGHDVGDRVLWAIANTIRSRVRATDAVARLGGDEFAVLLTSIGPLEAHAVAEELQRAVASTVVAVGADEVRVRASIGVGAVDGSTTTSAAQALAVADKAMYSTKRQRRALTLP